MTFRPPVRELLFCLKDVVGASLGEYLDWETCETVLRAGGQLAAETFAPLNRQGDREGARLENGQVRTATGFKEAYRIFAAGGWSGLSCDPEYGGQGLPKALDCAVFEMISAANLALGLCPMLSSGAAEAIEAHGSERQKALYLSKLLSGQWTGTMQLTESQAGSDLAALSTRAEPDGDGHYRLYGQKIFVTWGDHDLAENVVHLVLARLPDAPAGSRGISLFVASKRAVHGDGSLGAVEAVQPVGIEHKLGAHASPTCVMAFDGARAELIGQANAGLACMFTMMNAARVKVGIQGVGIAERAFQQALAFARERRQGRSAWTGEYPAPIVEHPDVRRMLGLMKCKTEAARAICLSTAVAADLARHGEDAETRRLAKLREEVLTPVAKAWSTDVGVEVASLGIQVHGGMGFVEEAGAAQHLRDARIPPIYEGTNGIQAIDLAGRKLGLSDGEGLRLLIKEVRETAQCASSTSGLEAASGRLLAGADAMQRATDWLSSRRGSADGLAGATPFLQLTGDVLGGAFLIKGAMAAATTQGKGFAAGRAALARFYAEQVMTTVPGLAEAVMQGDGELRALDAVALGG